MYEEMIGLNPNDPDTDGDGISDLDDDDPALPEWAQEMRDNDWKSDDDYEGDFNCHKNWVDNGNPVWSSGWPHYDKKMTVEWPAGSGDLWYPEGGAITQNEEPGHGHWWVCDGNYEGDDNPPSLDGILGVQDPEDWDCKPESTNVVGSIVQNEHLAIFCSFEFKITFEGADDTLDMHHLHIPFSSDEHWTVEFVLLDGYEILECKLDDVGELCEEMADGSFSGKGPAGVSMIKTVEEEPQPDCDYEIGLDSTGMAFDPIELKIKAGETVCWQWTNAEMEHNVLELEGEYDATMNITNINFGFSSGEPSATVDFRHTFTKDNMTHYYVCEPTMKLTLGNPSSIASSTTVASGVPTTIFPTIPVLACGSQT
jgi:plastocyanin